MNLLGLIVSFGLLMIAMTVHEFSHGFVAYKLGDNTAKLSGRLTLNPLAHIDPIWTVALPILLYITTNGQFVFGAAKPVPINYWALRNPKRDIVWIGASGPLSNFIFAFLLSLVIKFIPLPEVLSYVLTSLIVINVVLGIFNLLPIPPLDGSRVLMGLLPDELAAKYSAIEPYAFIILLALMWFGVIGSLIWPLVGMVLRIMGVSF